MTNLFSVATNNNSKGALGRTAELTAVCERIATELFDGISSQLDTADVAVAALKVEFAAAKTDAERELINAQIADTNIETDKLYAAVEASKTSHDSMDQLIADRYDLSAVNVNFLNAASDDEAVIAANDAELEKMIKSQQSKRSRAKAKTMTQDNYNTMMVGAIAENLLRMVTGKEKTNHGGAAGTKPVVYDEATLLKYSNNKELLNKEIRNIQSKKSIMKSKAGFDVQSEAYIQLLEAEDTLKALRGGASTATVIKTVVPDYVPQLVEIKQYVDANVGTVDINSLKAADAKDMLRQIVNLMSQVEVEDEVAVDQADSNEEQQSSDEQQNDAE